MYHYELVSVLPPEPEEGQWTVGYTTAWIELQLTPVPPIGTIKAGINSFTVFGY